MVKQPVIKDSIRQYLKAVFPVCCACGGQAWIVDHVIPYRQGGKNSIANFQMLCGPCNGRKQRASTDYRSSRYWMAVNCPVNPKYTPAKVDRSPVTYRWPADRHMRHRLKHHKIVKDST